MCRFTVNSCCCFSLSTGGYMIALTDLFFHVVRFTYVQEFQFHADYRLILESELFCITLNLNNNRRYVSYAKNCLYCLVLSLLMCVSWIYGIYAVSEVFVLKIS